MHPGVLSADQFLKCWLRRCHLQCTARPRLHHRLARKPDGDNAGVGLSPSEQWIQLRWYRYIGLQIHVVRDYQDPTDYNQLPFSSML